MTADANLELMQAMGSKKGYDPMPPDQYLCFLTSEDPLQRVLAWVRSKTIRKGHRSPFAVAENRTRPLTKADMAREAFGGDRGKACHAWDKAAAMGLVFVNDQGFLCLAGSVKIVPQKRRKKGESELPVQTALLPYQIETIGSLPDTAQKAFYADFEAFTKYEDALETDALNLARIQAAGIKDNMFRHYGVPLRRLDRKHRPDLHVKGSQLLQMSLLLVPEELLPYAEFAQTAPQVRTDSKNGSVQTAHTSLKIQREDSPSASSSSSEQIQSVSQSSLPEEERDRLTDIHDLLLETLGRKLHGELPTPALCQRIAAKLQDAPLQLLKERIKTRIGKITSMGMVESLAGDVAKRWEVDRSLQKVSDGPTRAEAIAYVRQHWNEYPDDERTGYLEVFPELRGMAKGAAS